MIWNKRGVVGGAGKIGVVDRGVEPAGDLGVEIIGDAVEELVDSVVVGLAARAVGLHESDACKCEGQVALDVGVDAEHEVAARRHGAVIGGVEGDLPGGRDRVVSPGVPGVESVEVEAGEDDVLVIDERRVLEEGRIFDRAAVLLGGAEVGQREDAVVVAGGRQRVEAAAHLADHRVDAAGAPGGAVVLAGGHELRRQAREQFGPADELRVLGARSAGSEQQTPGDQEGDKAETTTHTPSLGCVTKFANARRSCYPGGRRLHAPLLVRAASSGYAVDSTWVTGMQSGDQRAHPAAGGGRAASTSRAGTPASG